MLAQCEVPGIKIASSADVWFVSTLKACQGSIEPVESHTVKVLILIAFSLESTLIPYATSAFRNSLYYYIFKSLFFTHFPAYMKDMFSLRSSSFNLRGNNILSLRKPRTTSYGLNSFSFFSSKLWNTLPDSIRMSAFTDFKREIQGRIFV